MRIPAIVLHHRCAVVGVEWQRRWVVVDLGSGGAWGMRSDRSEGGEQFWVCQKRSPENFSGGGDVVAGGGGRLAGGWAGWGKEIRVYKFNLDYVATIKWVVELPFNARLLSSTRSETHFISTSVKEIDIVQLGIVGQVGLKLLLRSSSVSAPPHKLK
nr:hypothetical protein [Tanacetum cinerariifolium]